MTCVVRSAVCLGLNVYPVTIESALGSGFSGLQLIGVPQEYARDARERIRSALEALGVTLPARRLVISFRPSEVLKQFRSGLEHLDLPCALAILAALSQQQQPPGQLSKNSLQLVTRNLQSQHHLFAGQLTLSGEVLPPEQTLPFEIISAGQNQHRPRAMVWAAVPQEHVSDEAKARFLYIHSLSDCLKQLSQTHRPCAHVTPAENLSEPAAAHPALTRDSPSLQHQREKIKSTLQQLLDRPVLALALVTAAVGRHHILLAGSPGCGKTFALRRLKDLLPPLSPNQQLETALIHQRAVREFTQRPFRHPHHSCSAAALLGGSLLQPGEVSLAHHGLLFLDELSEFPRPALESLREPLDERKITLSRARGRVELPADFLLAGATNPCACGYFFSKTQSCRCVGIAPLKYQQKLSGPLLERFSILLLMDDILLAKHQPTELTQLATLWRAAYLQDPDSWVTHFVTIQSMLWSSTEARPPSSPSDSLVQILQARCAHTARSARAQQRLNDLLTTTSLLFEPQKRILPDTNFIKAIEQFRGFENALQNGVAFLTPHIEGNPLKLSQDKIDTNDNDLGFSDH